MKPYTSSTWMKYTNSDVRPNCCKGLKRAAVGRCTQAYATAMTAISSPTRMKKKLGELVQKCDSRYGDGAYEAANAAAAMVRPIAPNQRFRRASVAWSREASSNTPAAAPAKTKPDQGKNENVVRPAWGRR